MLNLSGGSDNVGNIFVNFDEVSIIEGKRRVLFRFDDTNTFDKF